MLACAAGAMTTGVSAQTEGLVYEKQLDLKDNPVRPRSDDDADPLLAESDPEPVEA